MKYGDLQILTLGGNKELVLWTGQYRYLQLHRELDIKEGYHHYKPAIVRRMNNYRRDGYVFSNDYRQFPYKGKITSLHLEWFNACPEGKERAEKEYPFGFRLKDIAHMYGQSKEIDSYMDWLADKFNYHDYDHLYLALTGDRIKRE